MIIDELARNDEARERFAAGTADQDVWERLYGSAYVLVVAVDQVLAYETRVRSLTGDAEPRRPAPSSTASRRPRATSAM